MTSVTGICIKLSHVDGGSFCEYPRSVNGVAKVLANARTKGYGVEIMRGLQLAWVMEVYAVHLLTCGMSYAAWYNALPAEGAF
jgi:hypothetical protein